MAIFSRFFHFRISHLTLERVQNNEVKSGCDFDANCAKEIFPRLSPHYSG